MYVAEKFFRDIFHHERLSAVAQICTDTRANGRSCFWNAVATSASLLPVAHPRYSPNRSALGIVAELAPEPGDDDFY
jgi:hypothetical protein